MGDRALPDLLFCFWSNMIDLVKSNEFGFWVPIDLCKSENEQAARDGKGSRRMIQGIASTGDKDLQEENVDQPGIDFSYFLEYGYYNNDHKPGFENKVGEPIEAKITKDGFWTKGFLYENHKVSDAIWELAHALESSGATRKLGFSIQGKVLRRAGKRIIKCWVQDVAITAAPINTNTWLDVVKSINAVPTDMWCASANDYEFTPEVVSKSLLSIPCSKSCTDCSCRTKDKSLSEISMDLRKDDDEPSSKKAFSTSSGAALVPESLDSKAKNQGYAFKSISFNECVELLRDQRGLSRMEATVLTEAVFDLNEIATN
jgi:hypothetical protein